MHVQGYNCMVAYIKENKSRLTRSSSYESLAAVSEGNTDDVDSVVVSSQEANDAVLVTTTSSSNNTRAGASNAAQHFRWIGFVSGPVNSNYYSVSHIQHTM